MPRTGRPKKPIALLRLTGGFRADRHGDAIELPVCNAAFPDWLNTSDRAKEYWPRISEMLANMGIMSAEFTPGLLALVDSLVDWVFFGDLAADLAKDGWSQDLDRVQGRKEKARHAFKEWCTEFGFTPQSIRNVARAEKKEKTGLEAFRLAK